MTQISIGENKELPVVLKADTQGSLEAIASGLSRISINDVYAKIIHRAIGDINETDIMLAKASGACVMGFNVKANPQARLVAERDRIIVGYFNIIYELFSKVEGMMRGLLAPVFEERTLGEAELRVVFLKGKVTKIAGCYVRKGIIRRSNSQVRIHRNGSIVFTGKIDTMKHEKDDVKDAKEGHECGIILDGFNDIKEGDIIECFEIVEVSDTTRA
jgi:translation initiation factor IF-2